MVFTIGLAQCGFPADGEVLLQVGRFANDAATHGVDLLAFPENLMSPRPLSASELRDISEPLDGPFVCGMERIARSSHLWMVFTMYEENLEGEAPFNTAVIMDDAGKMRGTYRKCHLYDAHGVLESERTKSGDKLFAPVETPFGRIGLGICYDLRFPEVARAAALGGCELLLFPSAWHDGSQKAQHWETLLRARAIENELFVAGICRAGEQYVGRSLVADPLGRLVASSSSKDEELIVCEVDTDAIVAAREAMPLLVHRRSELYS